MKPLIFNSVLKIFLMAKPKKSKAEKPWLIKSEAESNNAYGKRPDERSVDELVKTSVIIVDKHSGPTSHQITKSIYKIIKNNFYK